MFADPRSKAANSLFPREHSTQDFSEHFCREIGSETPLASTLSEAFSSFCSLDLHSQLTCFGGAGAANFKRLGSSTSTFQIFETS